VAYLESRGLNEQTVAMYRLGFVADPLLGDEEYVGRLAIPYITTGGVVQMRFRALNAEQSPKYMGKTGSKTLMFSVTSLMQDSDMLVICEGEIDAMTMNQCGIPAVGVPGANNWKPHWATTIGEYEHLYVLCDGDTAGRDFGKRVAGEMDGVTVINLPEGTDVNDLYVYEGADALRAKVGK
jgi:DNA primase